MLPKRKWLALFFLLLSLATVAQPMMNYDAAGTHLTVLLWIQRSDSLYSVQNCQIRTIHGWLCIDGSDEEVEYV